MTVREATPDRDQGSFAWAESPLALLIRDDRTHRLLGRLVAQIEALQTAHRRGAQAPVLIVTREELEYARSTWERAVLLGERRLHHLATLLAWELLGTRQLEHVARIIASPTRERGAHRIVIEERLSPEQLGATHDSGLASQIANRYLYRNGGDAFRALVARASFMELRPLETVPDAAATRVLTRVKVEDQIWNKVCDACFDIDRLVRRDKILNLQSKYIKDVFGIKVLTTDREASYEVAERMNQVRFAATARASLSCGELADPALELIEIKDYLALPPSQKKRTGWEAIKNVYRWCGQVFEVQIQTEANYHLEAQDLSNTSHRTFATQRELLRSELDDRVPYYREFRAVLRTLFQRQGDRGAPLPGWLELRP